MKYQTSIDSGKRGIITRTLDLSEPYLAAREALALYSTSYHLELPGLALPDGSWEFKGQGKYETFKQPMIIRVIEALRI